MSIILLVNDDILNIKKGIIVHGVNCQSVMGSGVARAIRDKYHGVYVDYIKYCATVGNKRDLLGHIVVSNINPDLVIVSGFTQEYYGRDKNTVFVDYRAVESVFKKVNELSMIRNLPVYFPLIGAGHANGSWETIKNIITSTLTNDGTLVLIDNN